MKDLLVIFSSTNISLNLLSKILNSFKVCSAFAVIKADLSRKIFFPLFLITPFFSNSSSLRLTLSLGILRSVEISLIFIFGISIDLSL